MTHISPLTKSAGSDSLHPIRGKRGDLIKVLWHDGPGMSLYAKRLERGRFIWPSPADGIVAITPAQLAYLTGAIRVTPPARPSPAERR